MSGIVLYPGAESRLLQHLHVKIRSLGNPLGLQKLVVLFEPGNPFCQFCPDGFYRLLYLLFRHHVVGCGEDDGKFQLCLDLPGEQIHLKDPVDLLPEEFDPYGILKSGYRDDLHHVTSDPESSPLEIQLISGVLDIDQPVDQVVTLHLHT